MRKSAFVSFVCFVGCLCVGCLCAGCAHLQLDNADRLIARPDFHDAARAAPLWTGEALKTINRLERELERK
jgi:hypothetical protein